MKLQDMFSPQLLKMANTYGKVVSGMERRKSALGGAFHTAGQAVDSLRRKMLGLGDTPAKVRVDTSQIDTANTKMGRLRDAMGRFIPGMGGGSSGGGSGGGFGRLMRGGALGGMMLGGIGGYLGMQGLQAANEHLIQPAFRSERTQFSTGVMLGDMGAGKSLMDQLAKYASDNPVFDKPEVQAAGQLLVGVNEQLGKIVPRLAMFGDVAAGSGNDLLGIVTIMAKIKAQTRVQGDELMQFMERRINILPALAQAKGVKQDEVAKLISKGQVSYEDVVKAFETLTGKGGTYYNMGNRMANETEGGQYQKVMGEMTEKAEQIGLTLLPYVTQVMGFVGELMGNMGTLETSFGTFSVAVSSAWGYVSQLLESLGLMNERSSAAQAIMGTLGVVFTFLGNAIIFSTGILTAFTDSPLAMLIAGITALPWLIGAVTGAWAALNAAFIASPIGLTIALVVGLAAAIMTAYDKVDWFREGLIKMWETAKSVFSNIGEFLKMIFMGDVVGAVQVIGKTFAEAKINGQNAVVANRNERLAKNNSKAYTGFSQGLPVIPDGMGGGGGKSNAPTGGLNATLANAKSSTINITIEKMIGESNFNVMDFDGDASALESMVMDMLARILRSAQQIQLG
jgi:tape measure domain-containing protein